MKEIKIVVLSDLHRRGDRAEQVLALHPNADGVFFLGDGLRLLPEETCREGGRLFAAVRGNCDGFLFGSDCPEERLVRLEEYTVMLMHGHTRSVKSGLDRAVRYAAERGADILLSGHTHVAAEGYLPAGSEWDGYVLRKPMWFMNPGSLGEPREGKPSYGLLQIRQGQILLSHGTVD